MKLFGAILTALAVAALWLLFAPMQAGGQAGYVIVNGDSMEPGLSSGDLAVIRRAERSGTGDVVTYRHPELGVVIHRIIGTDGARFIVQGDNNAWVDSHEPVQAEITGELWVALPGAGRYLGLVQQPALIALLTIVMGLTIMLPGRRKSSSQPRTAPSGLPTLSEQRGRDLLGLIAVIAIAALVIAGFAFTRSPQRQAVQEAPYEHHGSFDYSAAAPEGIYDGPEVEAGEPIFRSLIDSFEVYFSYDLSSGAPVESAGTARMSAELSAANGWTRSFELAPPADFEGTSTTLGGRIDLDQLQQVISRVEAETGIASRQYTLTLQPDVVVDASIGGQPVEERFAPAIAFQMDAQQLQLIRASSPEGSVLEQGAGGVVTQTRSGPNSLALGPIEIEVTRARQGSVAVLGMLLVAVAALVAQTFRTRGGTDAQRVAAMFAPRIVAVQPGRALEPETTVEVSGYQDFARLLEHHVGPIFQSGPAFFIDHDSQRYRFGPALLPPVADDPGPIEQAPVEPPARMAAVKAKPRRQFAINQILFKHRRRMERA